MEKYLGKRLDGRYEINELLGSGGMAHVYKAHDIIDGRTVAIKILKDEFLCNEEFVQRLKNESKAIAMLDHPNIIKVFDVSFGDRIQYIVMECVEGITLKEYLDKKGDFPWKDALHFTLQVLGALQHAHENGVVHRDIKPQNIILLQDGSIKVTDFGIARFSKYETRTLVGKAIGSVHYISPEQAKGEGATSRSDIYSVGVMLYEMLTGKLPFEADNAVSVAIMQMQVQPKHPCKINPEIPEGLEEITLKAMQKKAEHRYDSAVAMVSAIKELQRDAEIHFEYKYFDDDQTTKYIDTVSGTKGGKSGYDDDFAYGEEERAQKSKALSIVLGVGITVLVGIVVLGVGLAMGWFGSKDVEVPNFIGMKAASVTTDDKYKFDWNIEKAYEASKPEGVIIDQDPKPGSKRVKEGATITLVVNSSGTTVAVPVVRGQTLETAKTRLRDAGLLYETLPIEDTDTPEGIVKGTDPGEGAEVTVNTMVKIFVSKGPAAAKVAMPNLAGKNLADAKIALADLNLKLADTINYEKSTKPKDEVISTKPAAGEEILVGLEVVLTVSSGEPAEKTLSVYVDLPKNVTHEVSLKVYIDGVADTGASKQLIPAYTPSYTVPVKGSSGKKTVLVTLDGNKYRAYEVNFDTDLVKTRESLPYSDNVQTSASADPSAPTATTAAKRS